MSEQFLVLQCGEVAHTAWGPYNWEDAQLHLLQSPETIIVKITEP